MSVTRPVRTTKRPARRIARHTLLVLAAASLAACQAASLTENSGNNITTASIEDVSIKETAEVGKRWRADKKNVKLGLSYAASLKALGQTGEHLGVLDELARQHPKNTELQVRYGKELVLAGQSVRGQTVLKRVVESGKADWKTYSALGSALDQQGKHSEARGYYKAALKTRPGEVSILNNMGMSYLLDGNLGKAEEIFKRLDAMPASGKQPRIRQNLALSVGLQGRFDEAREIASRDLPPEAVEANLAYLRKMLAQNNTWQKLQSNSAKKTSG